MSGADRNLLFGILALQMDFVTREALLAAMNSWVLEKSKPLGQVLVEHAALAPERRSLLETLVDEHLRVHGNDVERSLAAAGPDGGLRDELSRINDPDLQATLGRHCPAAAHSVAKERGSPEAAEQWDTAPGGPLADPLSTRAPAVGTPTSAGLRFHILRPHARGGLGEVFVARDQELNREVALKQIQDGHADDPASRSRFLQEAEIAGGLEHPGIVPVYGLGRYADGRPFYAMRFIKGDSLKQAIERFHRAGVPGRDPGERALEFRKLLGRFLEVCNAIAYAHSRGVLHRDLKPSNVMLGPFGETLVVDWGLAKTLDRPDGAATEVEPLKPSSTSGSHSTQAGTAVGTPQYMSPEQAAGRLDRLGPATDVYSLGATLYCLLTGRSPFEDADLGEILQKVQKGDFPPPRAVNRDVPRPLDAVCRKAMALRPEDRYVSPRDLADDLEHWLAGEPVSAWPEPWTVRARRWVDRWRTLVASTAAAVLVAALTLGGATWYLVKAYREAGHQRDDAREQTKKRGEVLYVAHVNLAQRAWQDGRVGRVLDLLAAEEPRRAGQEDLRGFEWFYLRGLCRRDLLTLPGKACVAFSPDGRRLAAGADRTVKVWDAASGQEVLSLPGQRGEVAAVAFDAGGTHLATAGAGGVKLWDARSGAEMLRLAPELDPAGVAFGPGGKLLAAGGARNDKGGPAPGEVIVWESLGGKEVHRFAVPGKVTSVAFAPVGQRLAAAGQDGSITVWDVTAGRELASVRDPGGAVAGIAFSPDGRLVASADLDGRIRVWASAGPDREPLFTLPRHKSRVTGVVFTPDGDRLVSASWDGTVKIGPAESDDKGVVTLLGHVGWVTAVALSPDGSRIASAGADGTVKFWDSTVTDQEKRPLGDPPAGPIHRAQVACLAFSADGRRLATGSNDRTVKIWDPASGRLLLALPGHEDFVTCVAFAPDGRSVASAGHDTAVRLWDAATGKALHVLRGHEGPVLALAFTPDGRVVSAGVDRAFKVWEPADGKLIATTQVPTDALAAAAVSPDGRSLALASAEAVKLWTPAADHPSDLGRHPQPVTCLSFAPNGRLIASASKDGAIKLCDTAGREVFTLLGHTGAVEGLSFSADGKRLASVSADQAVKIWDLATGQEVLTLAVPRDWSLATCVAFRPDGAQLAAGGGKYAKGEAVLWDAAREMTKDEPRRTKE